MTDNDTARLAILYDAFQDASPDRKPVWATLLVQLFAKYPDFPAERLFNAGSLEYWAGRL